MARTYKHIGWIEHIGYLDYIIHGDVGHMHYLYHTKRWAIADYNRMVRKSNIKTVPIAFE